MTTGVHLDGFSRIVQNCSMEQRPAHCWLGAAKTSRKENAGLGKKQRLFRLLIIAIAANCRTRPMPPMVHKSLLTGLSIDRIPSHCAVRYHRFRFKLGLHLHFFGAFSQSHTVRQMTSQLANPYAAAP